MVSISTSDEAELSEDGRQPEEADVRVGRRIRALRLERGLSIAEAARRAGISIGALSQIERGLTSLKVRALWPLAAALEIEPHRLIDEGGDGASDLYVVRLDRRRSVPVRSEGVAKALLSPPGSALTGLLVTVAPGAGTGPEPYAHAGHEFAMVLSGEVEVTVDQITYRLKAGDSFAFKSTLPHGFRNPGRAPCEILWVNTAKPTEVGHGA